MDPISAGLLVAMASGAAGEAGKQLWTRLTGLVSRRSASAELEPVTAQNELRHFSENPHDLERARALSDALSARAQNDAVFQTALTEWHQLAQITQTGNGDTANTISGGTLNGPVLQGRDFSGISFQAPNQEQRPSNEDHA